MPRRYVIVIVVVAFVAFVAGLLLPVVQKVREAAARMTCHSHFKGLACGLHGYAQGHADEFPAGTVAHADLPPEQRLSWLLVALPYIEQDAVYKQFDLTRGPADPRNEKPASNRFRHLVCPSSGEHRYDNSVHHWKSATPLTHYVGVAGVGLDAATLPLGHPRAGVFGYDRRTALKDGFPDGISNTLLIIETANEPGHWAYGGTATVRAFESDAAPYIGPDRPFGGFHNGGMVLFGQRTHTCVAAMADTSVRSFTNATAPEVLEALATVAGKEPLPANW